MRKSNEAVPTPKLNKPRRRSKMTLSWHTKSVDELSKVPIALRAKPIDFEPWTPEDEDNQSDV